MQLGGTSPKAVELRCPRPGFENPNTSGCCGTQPLKVTEVRTFHHPDSVTSAEA